MEIKTKKLNKNTYTVICESWETYRSWGHKVTILKNNYTIQVAKITYINRTWEFYRYQTTILKAIRQEIDEQKAFLTDEYKSENNIKRITKNHIESLNNYINKNQYIKDLNKLYKYFNNREV